MSLLVSLSKRMNTHNNTSAGLKVLRLNSACFGPGKNSTFQELAQFTRQVFKLYYDVRQCFYPISLYGVDPVIN